MGLEIPVFHNVRDPVRGPRGRWTTTTTRETLTLPQSVLERSTDAFKILNRVHEDRPDYQGPVANLDNWRTMIGAL